jgi:dihydrodipicolinate synthase/N-acetylneuraminate lyase
MWQALTGVFPVFQTPFRDDDTIDAEVLAAEIDWMHGHGIDGIVMAMVSEVLRLSGDERRELARLCCELGLPHGPVVVSVGAESTSVAVGFARHAEDVGASAVMAIPPTAVAAGDDELSTYYRALLDAVEIPLIIQDASGYVGQPMSIRMQADLLEAYADRVLFKPEAVPIGPRLSELRDATGGAARVFEGSGGISLVDSHKRGIVGTMPGAEVCWAIVALWNALVAGDQPRIDSINGPLCALISLQTSLDAFIAVEKHLLVRQGVFTNAAVRGPVGYRLDPETTAEVDRLFELLRDVVG